MSIQYRPRAFYSLQKFEKYLQIFKQDLIRVTKFAKPFFVNNNITKSAQHGFLKSKQLNKNQKSFALYNTEFDQMLTIGSVEVV